MFVLKCGNVELPAPVSMSVADEIIWSSDTGRTLTGTMVGDVVAEKSVYQMELAYRTAGSSYQKEFSNRIFPYYVP